MELIKLNKLTQIIEWIKLTIAEIQEANSPLQ